MHTIKIMIATIKSGLDKLMNNELCRLVHLTGFLLAGSGYSATKPKIVIAVK